MSGKDSALGRRDMEALLREEETGCLCMSRDGLPYAVPVSYAYLDGEIVLHSKPGGRKLETLRANPKVCFVVSRNPDRARPHRAEGACSFPYESVLCFGEARVIDDAAERLRRLREFKDYFYKRLGLDPAGDPVTEKAAGHTACVAISVKEMTGKRKSPKK